MPLPYMTPIGSTERPGERSRHLLAISAILALVVVVLRVVLTRHLSFCGTPDACFYLGLAENLGTAHSFQTRFLYNYQQSHLSIPGPGIDYWRPGVSLILLLARPFGAITLHSSIVISSLVGVLFSAAAWHIASVTYGDRRVALASFALCLSLSPVWIGSFTPDSGLYYGAAVAWFLALFTVRRQGLLQDIVALAGISLAYLIRNDAALLIVPLAVVLWRRLRRRDADLLGIQAGSSPLYAVGIVLGFALALAPMHAIYRAVLGHAFPSGTAQTLYFRGLDDFNRYQDPVSLHRLLAEGPGHLLKIRLATFASILYRFGALMIGYPALIFLAALPFLRNEQPTSRATSSVGEVLPELTGAAAFSAVALAAYSLALPAIGAFAALRTAISLLPLASVLVVVAIVRVARTPTAAIVLTAGVVAANSISGVMQDLRDVSSTNGTGATDRAEAHELANLGAQLDTALVLTPDPIQFSVTTGYATAPLPSNGLDAIVNAAHDLHATHVILDTENLPTSFADLNRRLRPVHSSTLPESHALLLELPHTP